MSPVSYCSDSEFAQLFGHGHQDDSESIDNDRDRSVSPFSDCSDHEFTIMRYKFKEEFELKSSSRPHQSFALRGRKRSVSPASYCSDAEFQWSEAGNPPSRMHVTRLTVPLMRFEETKRLKVVGPFKCGFCSRRFFKEKAVVRHEKYHRSDQLRTCQICDEGFPSVGYQFHMSDRHGIRTGTYIDLTNVVKKFIKKSKTGIRSGGRPHSHKTLSNVISQLRSSHTFIPLSECPICGDRFKRVRTHFIQAHPEEDWQQFAGNESEVKHNKKEEGEEEEEKGNDSDKTEKEQLAREKSTFRRPRGRPRGRPMSGRGGKVNGTRRSHGDKNDEEVGSERLIVRGSRIGAQLGGGVRVARAPNSMLARGRVSGTRHSAVGESKESDEKIRSPSRPKARGLQKPEGIPLWKIRPDDNEEEKGSGEGRILSPVRSKSERNEDTLESGTLRGRAKRQHSACSSVDPQNEQDESHGEEEEEGSDEDDVASRTLGRRVKLKKRPDPTHDSEDAAVNGERSDEEVIASGVRQETRQSTPRRPTVPRNISEVAAGLDEMDSDMDCEAEEVDEESDEDDPSKTDRSREEGHGHSSVRKACDDKQRRKLMKSMARTSTKLSTPIHVPKSTMEDVSSNTLATRDLKKCQVCKGWYKNVALHKKLSHSLFERGGPRDSASASDGGRNGKRVSSFCPDLVREVPEKKRKRLIGPRSVMSKLRRDAERSSQTDNSDDMPELSPQTRPKPKGISERRVDDVDAGNGDGKVIRECRICHIKCFNLGLHFQLTHPDKPIVKKIVAEKTSWLSEKATIDPDVEVSDDCDVYDSSSTSDEDDNELATVGKVFACEQCPLKLADSRSLSLHAAVHSDRKSCPVCRNAYPDMAKHFATKKCGRRINLARPTAVQSPEVSNKLECQVCYRTFRQSFQLKEHRLTHESDNLHVCDVCGVRFKKPLNLYLHKVQEHNYRTITDKTIRRKPMGPKSVCRTSAAEESSGAKSEIPNVDREWDVRAKTGYEDGNGKHDVPSRMASSKVFKTKKTLMNLSKTHLGRKPFQCENCGKTFAKKIYLHAHYKRRLCF